MIYVDRIRRARQLSIGAIIDLAGIGMLGTAYFGQRGRAALRFAAVAVFMGRVKRMPTPIPLGSANN